MPTWGAPTRSIHWLRPSAANLPGCHPSAFMSVTTKCCWTTRSDMLSVQSVERAVAAGVDARADVWMGMPHGFPGSIGRLNAAAQALDAVGAFLTESCGGTRAREA